MKSKYKRKVKTCMGVILVSNEIWKVTFGDCVSLHVHPNGLWLLIMLKGSWGSEQIPKHMELI